MNNRELRLGNFIQQSSIKAGGSIIEKMKVGAPNGFLKVNAEYFMFYLDSYLFSPIPITEEWLIKFGFLKTSIDGNFYSLYLNDSDEESFSRQRIEVIGLKYIELCRSGICFKRFECKYIHELQNLYYALTGKELELR